MNTKIRIEYPARFNGFWTYDYGVFGYGGSDNTYRYFIGGYKSLKEARETFPEAEVDIQVPDEHWKK